MKFKLYFQSYYSHFKIKHTNQLNLQQNNSLAFNKYAYLTTHNSFAIDGEPSHTGIPRLALPNQDDSITQQLNVSPYIHRSF